MLDVDRIGFTHAFYAALDALKNGCPPIGCAILDEKGRLIARGENSQYAHHAGQRISDHPLAHAEINAILKTDAHLRENIASHTLYATLEPCPLCFGAIVMGGIRKVKFAARDKDNDFVKLNTALDFIAKKGIAIEGPLGELEAIQIALLVYRRLEKGVPGNERALRSYESYCPQGLRLARRWLADDGFRRALEAREDSKVLWERILCASLS